MSRVDVRVIGAKNVLGRLTKPNLYCVVKFLEQVHQTNVESHNENPEWNEVFQFDVPSSASATHPPLPASSQPALVVEVWNKAMLSGDMVGFVEIPLASLPPGAIHDRWHPLLRCKSNAEIRLRILLRIPAQPTPLANPAAPTQPAPFFSVLHDPPPAPPAAAAAPIPVPTTVASDEAAAQQPLFPLYPPEQVKSMPLPNTSQDHLGNFVPPVNAPVLFGGHAQAAVPLEDAGHTTPAPTADDRSQVCDGFSSPPTRTEEGNRVQGEAAALAGSSSSADRAAPQPVPASSLPSWQEVQAAPQNEGSAPCSPTEEQSTAVGVAAPVQDRDAAPAPSPRAEEETSVCEKCSQPVGSKAEEEIIGTSAALMEDGAVVREGDATAAAANTAAAAVLDDGVRSVAVTTRSEEEVLPTVAPLSDEPPMSSSSVATAAASSPQFDANPTPIAPSLPPPSQQGIVNSFDNTGGRGGSSYSAAPPPFPMQAQPYPQQPPYPPPPSSQQPPTAYPQQQYPPGASYGQVPYTAQQPMYSPVPAAYPAYPNAAPAATPSYPPPPQASYPGVYPAGSHVQYPGASYPSAAAPFQQQQPPYAFPSTGFPPQPPSQYPSTSGFNGYGSAPPASAYYPNANFGGGPPPPPSAAAPAYPPEWGVPPLAEPPTGQPLWY